jgi:peptidoglycan/xylan/chitin deacetylase (PgdA/CDA1 family)
MEQRILEFHGIGEPRRPFDGNEGDYWVSTPQFEAALDLVAEFRRKIRGHDRNRMHNTKPCRHRVPESSPEILLTFDDGNRSDYEVALPRLVERGLVGHFFVLSGRLDKPCSLGPREVREMAAAGMTIGLHGQDHVSWRDADEATLEREVAHARNALADAAQCEVADVAIPFGRYDGRVMRRLSKAGFRTVYTSDGGAARSGSWVKPRLAVKRSTTPDQLYAMLSGAEPIKTRALRGAKMLIKRWI